MALRARLALLLACQAFIVSDGARGAGECDGAALWTVAARRARKASCPAGRILVAASRAPQAELHTESGARSARGTSQTRA